MKVSVLAGFCAVAMAPALATGQATIQGIGDLPGGEFQSEAWGVSGDGKVVVGASSCDSPDWPYVTRVPIRWTEADGISSLGYPPPGGGIVGARDASADGSIIAGLNYHPKDPYGNLEAFRWAEGGVTWLGSNTYSEAFATNADGSVLVGRVNHFIGEAFRWTEDKGMVGLGFFWEGYRWSHAQAVSANGEVVVGESRAEQGSEAFRWTEAEGMVGLGDLPGGDFYSTAWAVSADGTTIMGCSASDKGMELYRWTQADGMVGLGLAPPGTKWNFPNYANADGSVVVGFLTTNYPDGYPFIWTEAEGARPLRDVLIESGAPEAADWKLVWANGISDDGRTIVGTGDNPQGLPEGWVATLAPACGADLDGSGTLDLFDFLAFANLFNVGDPRANCDQDGSLDLFDFLCFTNAFNAGC